MTKSIHRQGHYFNQFSYYILLEHNGIVVVHMLDVVESDKEIMMDLKFWLDKGLWILIVL